MWSVHLSNNDTSRITSIHQHLSKDIINSCRKNASFLFGKSGVQNWFGLTEKFQVLKICLRKIPKFASGNFFNVAILVRFCSRVLLDDSAVLNFAPEFSQTASPSEFCLRQVRYLAPPAPKSFNFTFSSLRLENLPPAWKFAPGEVLSISPQFCTPAKYPCYSLVCLERMYNLSDTFAEEGRT